jgi:glucose/arabinose dehydrogenase
MPAPSRAPRLLATALTLAVACDISRAGPNQPPVALITTPSATATYAAGDTIQFSGTALDREDGTIGASGLSWWVVFHHASHTHPFLPEAVGSSGGSVAIPLVGETSDSVWYRFYLRAEDTGGAADTAYRDVMPRKASVTLASAPSGLQVTLDGQPRTTPLTVTSVVGMQREIGVVTPQTVNGTTYAFSTWSDGGGATHTVRTPAATTTYTATFATVANVPPTVTLTAPASGDSAVVNTAVAISATAADADGNVAMVEFFDGATSLGIDNSSPYGVSWTPTAVATHTLTARATDNVGATTTSAAVSFKVTSPAGPDTQAPVATLTAPADQSTNLTGALTLTATTTDNVGVVGVQFQVDGEDLGTEDASAPYQATLAATNVYTTGVHVLRARARDAAGNLSAWATATVTFGNNVNMPAGFTRTTYTSGLAAVTAMAFAPDGRLFICQQNGQLRVVPQGGGPSSVFHTFSVNSLGERGLLGVAFHPDFASNRWIYVYYTTASAPIHNRVSRIVASVGNPDVSDTTETVLVDLPDLNATNHNGGAIHFSPTDGKLYVAVGENAVGSNAQSLTTRFGKMLRYNADAAATIPSDNPFLGTTSGVNQAIWALGLRNPFTFTFQPGSGRMIINDVGQNTWEEINEGLAGSNYGWPTTEGPTANPSFRSPIYAYQHTTGLVTGFAIVGAAFYNPPVTTFPAVYAGDYFFGDYVNGWVNRMDVDNDNAVYAFARIGGNVFDIHTGPDGGLYVAANGGSSYVVYRYQHP